MSRYTGKKNSKY